MDAAEDKLLHIPIKHRFLENLKQKLSFFLETNSKFSNFAERSE